MATIYLELTKHIKNVVSQEIYILEEVNICNWQAVHHYIYREGFYYIQKAQNIFSDNLVTMATTENEILTLGPK